MTPEGTRQPEQTSVRVMPTGKLMTNKAGDAMLFLFLSCEARSPILYLYGFSFSFFAVGANGLSLVIGRPSEPMQQVVV